MLELVQMTVTLTKLRNPVISLSGEMHMVKLRQVVIVKRIKPPLPPMKKTLKAPLRRSARNQAKMSQEVT